MQTQNHISRNNLALKQSKQTHIPNSSHQQTKSGFSLISLLVQFVAGIIIIIFNVPGFLLYSSHHYSMNSTLANLFENAAQVPQSTYSLTGVQNSELFELLIAVSLYGIVVYLGISLLLSISKGTLSIFLAAVSGLICGFFLFSGMLWILTFALWISHLVIELINTISPYLIYIAYLFCIGIGMFLIYMIIESFGSKSIFLLGLLVIAGWFLWPYTELVIQLLGLVAVLAIGIATIAVIWTNLSLPGTTFFGGVLLVLWLVRAYVFKVVTWLIIKIFLPVIGFLTVIAITVFGYLAIVFTTVIKLIVFIFFTSIGIGFIAFIGNLLLIGEIQAAWKSGHGKSQIFLSGAGIGMGVALIFLASSDSPVTCTAIDDTWQNTITVAENIAPTEVYMSTVPVAFHEDMKNIFRDSDFPIFDVGLLAAVLGLSFLGVAQGFWIQSSNKTDWYYLKTEALLLLLVPLLVVLMAFLPSEDN